MPEIDDESLDEFVRLYRESLGEEISRDDALILARNLVFLYERMSKNPKD